MWWFPCPIVRSLVDRRTHCERHIAIISQSAAPRRKPHSARRRRAPAQPPYCNSSAGIGGGAATDSRPTRLPRKRRWRSTPGPRRRAGFASRLWQHESYNRPPPLPLLWTVDRKRNTQLFPGPPSCWCGQHTRPRVSLCAGAVAKWARQNDTLLFFVCVGRSLPRVPSSRPPSGPQPPFPRIAILPIFILIPHPPVPPPDAAATHPAGYGCSSGNRRRSRLPQPILSNQRSRQARVGAPARTIHPARHPAGGRDWSIGGRERRPGGNPRPTPQGVFG